MIPKDRRQLAAGASGVLLVVAAIAAALVTDGTGTRLQSRAADDRPALLLLTSLPILFPEDMELSAEPPTLLAALGARYTVAPISLADRASLGGHQLLLMAQPQAQPAEVLVELDQWVRDGGHVLLLADPALEWPSKRPLGSVLRPPLAFPDTGLLGHWGVRLDAPDSLGPKTVQAGGRTIRTEAPGRLAATGGNCAVESGFVARCRIGGGQATVIADADFVGTSDSRSSNLAFLLGEIDRLEQ